MIIFIITIIVQLIFGESKTYEDMSRAISDAFQSINDFKHGVNDKRNQKSGLQYEKSLISDNLFKKSFSEEDYNFLESLIYPTKERKFDVDNAFGVFIGFHINITDDDKAMLNAEFRKKIKDIVDSEVSKRIEYKQKKIKDHNLLLLWRSS